MAAVSINSSVSLVDRMESALRRSGLHRQVADTFAERCKQGSSKDAIVALFNDGHDVHVVAKCLGDTFEYPVMPDEAKDIADYGSGWVLTQSGVMYVANPFDQALEAELMAQYRNDITDWGVLPHNSEDDIASAKRPIDPDAASNDALLDQILLSAHRRGSSDIHIRVMGNEGRVRIRIDGRLVTTQTLSLADNQYFGVVNRVLSRCEKTPGAFIAPVSGQFQFVVGSSIIPVRVEVAPTRVSGTIYPNATLRLMGTSSSLKDLGALGFPDTQENPQLTRIRRITRRPHGLILVTGPTGSGKTTSLYAMLKKMMTEDPDRAYFTLEDPQEVEVPGADQIQMNPQAGLTFATGLRSLLRKDPDVILLGEIRDQETMNEAIRASLTGHLVLSTVHTNSSIDTIMRLVDMGCDPTLAANTIEGILAQRLLRRVCQHCSTQLTWRDLYTLNHPALKNAPPELVERYRDAQHVYADLASCPRDDDVVRLMGEGCEHCAYRGFHGRAMITETLVPSRAMRDLIAQNASPNKLRNFAINECQFVEMWGHALARVRAQQVTLDEAVDTLKEREPPTVQGLLEKSADSRTAVSA